MRRLSRRPERAPDNVAPQVLLRTQTPVPMLKPLIKDADADALHNPDLFLAAAQPQPSDRSGSRT